MGIKISDLTSATSLTGSEEIPIVQSGNTKKATVSQVNADNYSTIEQVVGTWIDGKPLYRKVGSVVMTSKGSHYQGTLIGNNLEYATIESVFLKGAPISNNLYNSFNNTIENNVYITTDTTNANYGYIMAFTNRDDLVNKTVYASVLYTKSTDSAS